VPAAPDPDPEPDTIEVTDEPAAEPEPEPETVAEGPKPAPEPEAKEAAPEPKDEEEKEEDEGIKLTSKHLKIEGYLQPQYTYRVRRGARPRDQQEFGAQQTRAGLIFSGHVLPKWSYRAHFVIGSRITRVVTGIDDVDYEGDGTTDNLAVKTSIVPGVELEQLWVNYNPVRVEADNGMEAFSLNLRLGQMRVPFSRQNKTQNNSLLFPRRNQVVTSFLVSSDLGGLLEADFADKRVTLSGGVFNGTGLAVNRDNRRGPLWSAQLEVAPLGYVCGYECALELDKRPRFAIGTGMLYSPYRLFDSAGNDTLTRARDLLVSASAKFVMHGFYVFGEFIRRQVTDNLSSRPFVSTGAYGQISYAIPVTKRAFIAPLGNFGWAATEQAVAPLNRYYTSDGIAVYLPNKKRLDAVRVSLLYQGEWLVDEGESAQGGTLQVQLKF
jgi:hypothetical protein